MNNTVEVKLAILDWICAIVPYVEKDVKVAILLGVWTTILREIISGKVDEDYISNAKKRLEEDKVAYGFIFIKNS